MQLVSIDRARRATDLHPPTVVDATTVATNLDTASDNTTDHHSSSDKSGQSNVYSVPDRDDHSNRSRNGYT